MLSRTQTIIGSNPILIIAPHGPDDPKTDLMATYIAEAIGAFAVINCGWEKAETVDCFTDKADCNNLFHCQEEVVNDEFLGPILRYKHQIFSKFSTMHQFILHGVGKEIRQKTGDVTTDLVIGYGAGDFKTQTVPLWYRDLFVYLCEKNGMTTFAAKLGSPYGGRGKKNLNQLWRQWYTDKRINSLQIEIVSDIRASDTDARFYSAFLADVITQMAEATKATAESIVPIDFALRTV